MFIKSFFIIAVALPVLIISTILIYFLNLSRNNPPPFSQNQNAPKKPLTIILSAHFDDAALSLGGLIAKRENPTIVATFFTGGRCRTSNPAWSGCEAVYRIVP